MTDPPQKTKCPNCGEILSVPIQAGGQSVTCSVCHHTFRLPFFESDRSEPPPPPPPISIDLPKEVATRTTVEIGKHSGKSKGPTVSSSLLDVFDLQFNKYLTPWIIRLNWFLVVTWAVICLSLILFAMIATWIPEANVAKVDRPPGSADNDVAFRLPEMSSWLRGRLATDLYLITLAFAIVEVVLWVRMFFESRIVIFNIAMTLDSIGDVTRATAIPNKRET